MPQTAYSGPIKVYGWKKTGWKETRWSNWKHIAEMTRPNHTQKKEKECEENGEQIISHWFIFICSPPFVFRKKPLCLSVSNIGWCPGFPEIENSLFVWNESIGILSRTCCIAQHSCCTPAFSYCRESKALQDVPTDTHLNSSIFSYIHNNKVNTDALHISYICTYLIYVPVAQW